MKTLIAAILIVSANNAAAAGFSPWTDNAINDRNVSVESTEVANAGFGPWRDRNVSDEIRLQPTTGIAAKATEQNVFRPWS